MEIKTPLWSILPEKKMSNLNIFKTLEPHYITIKTKEEKLTDVTENQTDKPRMEMPCKTTILIFCGWYNKLQKKLSSLKQQQIFCITVL